MGALLDLTSQHAQQDHKAAFFMDVVAGLSQSQKTLPCKYFYDELGSQLFEKICELDEYYVTRTELQLLNQVVNDIATHIGPDAAIIEPGSGAGQKIRLLLDSLDSPRSYIPVEISKEILIRSVEELSASFPTINMRPIAGDFSNVFSNPHYLDHEQLNFRPAHKKVVFFPGSTIGNFETQEAIAFLKKLANSVGKGGGLLIGVDLIKDREILLDAYNDQQGITADFNKNLLRRINQELKADFDLAQFAHRSTYNEAKDRIEMHSISEQQQTINIDKHQFTFAVQETIHTENSHKYSLQSFAALASKAGFNLINVWTDDNQWFGIFYFEV